MPTLICSVADPDPSDPYVFGPPGSGDMDPRIRIHTKMSWIRNTSWLAASPERKVVSKVAS